MTIDRVTSDRVTSDRVTSDRVTSDGARGVVSAALVATAGLAAAKLGAVLSSGASAMLSSTVHGLIDLSSLALLLHGLVRHGTAASAARAPLPASALDRELYFWSFAVAILLYAMGAGVTLHEGADRIWRPQPAMEGAYDLMVLLAGIAVASAIGWLTVQRLQAARAAGLSLWALMRRPGNAALLVVLVQSAAAIAGQALAIAGLTAAHVYGIPGADGAASLAIGLVMAMVAATMAIEVRRVLVVDAVGGKLRPGGSEAAAASPALAPAPLAAPMPSTPITAAPALETKSMGAPATASGTVRSAAAGTAAAKPQVLARPHGKKGRGKHRR